LGNAWMIMSKTMLLLSRVSQFPEPHAKVRNCDSFTQA
jgi:hypothetical protein